MPTTDSSAVLARGRGAIITGAASGIGFAAARRFVTLGMRVCIADLDAAALEAAAVELAGLAPGGTAEVLSVRADVSSPAEVDRLASAAFGRFGDIAVLMNNAAAFEGGDSFSDKDAWRHLLEVNVLGVLNGVQRIGRAMIDQGKPGAIINTGSKQGITSPPGNTAYNVTKAAVKSLTEGLAHTLRNIPGCLITAHLLIPGFTYTGNMAKRVSKKPAAAWLPEQVAERLIEGLVRNEFYILCQDSETTRDQDERRILWAAGDIVENRSALSRWDPEYKEAFDAFMAAARHR
jgi:NAD(P)-dependent dehydrogenase (short-subunit alcohol dehydrogenase family)